MRKMIENTYKAIYGLVLMVLVLFVCVQPAYAGELMEETVRVELLSEGAIVDVGCESMDVLRGEEAWEGELRNALINAFDSYQKQLDTTYLQIPYNENNKNKMLEIYRDIINSNGKYFYLSGGVSWNYYEGGNLAIITFWFSEKYLDADGNLNIELVKQRQNAYEARVQEILACLDENMTDLEKITFLHDFIVRECDYDYDDYLKNSIPEDSYTAYGVLVNGVAVCQGYAETLLDLATRLGIPCVVVSSNAMSHAWNMVQLDGNWYHIDATWDDPTWEGYDQCKAGYVRHDYFLLSDDEMLAMEHYGWSSNAPQANKDGSYQGYIFRNNDKALNYHGRKWYWLKSGKITYGNLEGSQITSSSLNNNFTYLHMQNGIMYLANDTGIYQVTDLNINNVKEVKTWASDVNTQNKQLFGFAIINRTLVGEFVSNNKVERIVIPKKSHAIQGATSYSLTTWGELQQLNISKGDSPYEMTIAVTNPEILSLDNNLVMDPKKAGATTIVAKVPGDCLNEAAELVISIHVSQVFADVSPDKWYDPFVEYVYENNMMSGKGKDANGNNLFDPGNYITRGEFVQTLYNKEGKPAVNYESKFTDVPENAWYAKAVLWAAQNGIVSGKKADWFDANGYITRQEMAVVLYKYAKYLGLNTPTGTDLNQYGDGSKVASWGKNAMEWAVTGKIMNGKGSGTDISKYLLDPNGKATRAETATMIKNFMSAY